MSKGSFVEMNCPIAQTLEQVGEWWTFVILRNAFCGMSRFQDFQRDLGISTNVLTRRLARLVESGIFSREVSATDARVVHYRLTAKGFSLYPVLAAMTLWGEKWAPNPLGARLTMVEKATGLPVAGVGILAADGRALTPAEIDTVAGPAADEKTHALMRMREETNKHEQ
ncbi:winged helix-turn-helix transcriptional regulator [Pseudoduganella buxea]|uniref:Transcriptional regulator n=1 Tax=Pseudoduganella buxea TaxID=1949069 RepID=A0A6I3SZX8_9BURK|nr:helix-turn-helix domain-containing protein [Pseudoduganella buxea]MTV54175.1 transcriptional regulator [Pseudoduganella buxea]GGC15249.1 transcriptional regulator [Pseudoduganella buxea]